MPHSDNGALHHVNVPEKMPTEFASGLSTNEAGFRSLPGERGENYGGASTIVIGKQDSFGAGTAMNMDGYAVIVGGQGGGIRVANPDFGII